MKRLLFILKISAADLRLCGMDMSIPFRKAD
jgi:hypothetical protein